MFTNGKVCIRLMTGDRSREQPSRLRWNLAAVRQQRQRTRNGDFSMGRYPAAIADPANACRTPGKYGTVAHHRRASPNALSALAALSSLSPLAQSRAQIFGFDAQGLTDYREGKQCVPAIAAQPLFCLAIGTPAG